MEANSALQLAALYREANQKGKLAGLTKSMLSSSNLPPQLYFKLATTLREAGMIDHMNRALASFEATASNNVPPEAYVQVARIYAQTRQVNKMLKSLDKYLALRPTDWRAWLDRATVMMELKQTNAATDSINRALSVGGQEALDTVRNDKRFASLIQTKQKKASSLLNLGRGR
jgi:Flp pilus assembly protein TadD